MENMFEVLMEPANDWRSYWVYAIYNVGPSQTPIYIGHCEARELMTAQAPRRNSAWLKLIAENPTAKFILRAVSKHSTVEEARTEANKLAYAMRPWINANGIERNRKRRVRCMDNGMEFNTVTEAARWIECTQPTMSAHLGRYPGYNTIKGFTFERVD